ncbi:hypothetical protein OE88DRAFT_1659559 [Heliocybe sulcata]|uniref:Uncharacterized protein n=1 Tax=Heliocybe sulcata TaxID=5364 RepID=A0A5C3N1K8_9AGAM|nr:hypothetical protein OE88DRAFT_1659559 [Heliocybe sulcata]
MTTKLSSLCALLQSSRAAGHGHWPGDAPDCGEDRPRGLYFRTDSRDVVRCYPAQNDNQAFHLQSHMKEEEEGDVLEYCYVWRHGSGRFSS